MAEQEFWSSQFLNRLNWKGAVSYEKEKYSRLCLKVLNLLSSIMCLLTYIYNPLLQAIKKKKHGDRYNNYMYRCTKQTFVLYCPVVMYTD